MYDEFVERGVVKELEREDGTCSAASGPFVKGRLSRNLGFWENVLQAPEPILSIIRQGYFSVPESRLFNNQSSAKRDEEFVSQAAAELVSNGCVVEVKELPYDCNPLLVVTSHSGKKRLVVNVNQYLRIDKFKYEDMRMGLMFFEQGEITLLHLT